jgi:hypothetical protein
MKEMFHSQNDWPSYDIKNETTVLATVGRHSALGQAEDIIVCTSWFGTTQIYWLFLLTKAFVDNFCKS